MSEKRGGRAFGVMKRKTFIIAVLAVCGVVLLAEAILLIKAFSGKKEKKKEPETDNEETGETVWLLTGSEEVQEGEYSMKRVYEYDEQGRLIGLTETVRYPEKASEIVSVATVTYEKSGVSVTYSEEDDIEACFYRDPWDECSGESAFRVPQAEYLVECDDRGFWKRITYRQTDREVTTVTGRDYEYDDAGRMTLYRDWQKTEGIYQMERDTRTVTFEYDENGRVSHYHIYVPAHLSFSQPADYLVEYGDGFRKETCMRDEEVVNETEWVYEKCGTWKKQRRYSEYFDRKATVRIEWTVKMPDSYLYEEPVTIGDGAYWDEDDSPVFCETDEEGRVILLEERLNGKEYTAEYDEKGRITRLSFRRVNGEYKEYWEYSYDRNGNVTERTKYEGGQKAGTTRFEYTKMRLKNPE